ncbi:MAG: DUF2318 domain-containing protein [Synergistaceae bacterium]|jgi:uncharacterized membrane protein|nr:DUF2318 domain-containing protein [Synergistaceae bacterium]
MLAYLIKVTTNTLYMVIPLAMLLALAARIDRAKGGKFFAGGLAAGLTCAFVFAVLKRNTGFAVREYYDLGVLLPSVPACAAILAAQFFAASGGRAELGAEVRARRRAVTLGMIFCASALSAAYILPNLLLYPFEFAVGMDTIFNTEFMFKAIGYSGGVLLMFLTGAAVYRAASGLGTLALSTSLGLSMAVLLSKHALTIAQILLGRNMIRRYKPLTRGVMWTLTHVNAFVYLMMTIAVVIAVAQFARVKSTPPSGGNPAQIRRSKYLARRQARFCVSVVLGLAVSLATVTVGISYNDRRVELSPPIEIAPTGDSIVIPLGDVDDGNLHRFAHKVLRDGQAIEVRYIVIKKNDTAYGVGLDACDVCGPTGYYQRKNQVICILCDVVMNKSTIGLPGGCNPVPLKFAITEGSMVISTSDLAAEARRF